MVSQFFFNIFWPRIGRNNFLCKNGPKNNTIYLVLKISLQSFTLKKESELDYLSQYIFALFAYIRYSNKLSTQIFRILYLKHISTNHHLTLED
jgi:hypothetical protein